MLIILPLLLFINCYYAISSTYAPPFSSIIKDNKLYIFDSNKIVSERSSVSAYELKDGNTSSIISSGKNKFVTGVLYKTFQFLDIPQNIQGLNNNLWMIGGQIFDTIDEKPFNSLNWLAAIRIDDLSFDYNDTLIEIPSFEKFPKSQFTATTVANDKECSLYIIGGLVYDQSEQKAKISNLLYKYNFNTKMWIDLTTYSKGKLPPITDHRTVVIDNRYLVLLGGKMVNGIRVGSNLQYADSDLAKPNSLNSIWVYDTFTNTFENINPQTEIVDGIPDKFEISGFTANVYNNKIYIIGGESHDTKAEKKSLSTKIGVFDYKARRWTWSPVLSETGAVDFGATDHSTLLFEDQLMIITAYSNFKPSLSIFDLATQKLKSTLKVNGETHEGSPKLPTYAIILIGVGCTMVLLLIAFFFYYKIKHSRSENLSVSVNSTKPIQEIWSDPEAPNMEQILSGHKGIGLYINTDQSSGFDIVITKSNSNASNTLIFKNYKSHISEIDTEDHTYVLPKHS